MHCNPLTKSPLASQTFTSKRCLKPTDRWLIQPADMVEDPLPLIQLQTTMVHHPSPWSTASFCKPRFQNVILLSFQSKCITILYPQWQLHLWSLLFSKIICNQKQFYSGDECHLRWNVTNCNMTLVVVTLGIMTLMVVTLVLSFIISIVYINLCKWKPRPTGQEHVKKPYPRGARCYVFGDSLCRGDPLCRDSAESGWNSET